MSIRFECGNCGEIKSSHKFRICHLCFDEVCSKCFISHRPLNGEDRKCPHCSKDITNEVICKMAPCYCHECKKYMCSNCVKDVDNGESDCPSDMV